MLGELGEFSSQSDPKKHLVFTATEGNLQHSDCDNIVVTTATATTGTARIQWSVAIAVIPISEAAILVAVPATALPSIRCAVVVGCEIVACFAVLIRPIGVIAARMMWRW